MTETNPENHGPVDAETRRRLVELRLEQVKAGIPRAIEEELDYCRKHNFPIWIAQDGKLYDDNDFTRGKAEYGSHL